MLGDRIKFLRLELHISQRHLADLSSISQATISRCEGNITRQLKSDAMKRLATALRTTTDFLSGKEDFMDARAILRSDPGVKEFLDLYGKINEDSRVLVKSYMKYLSAEVQDAQAL